MLFLADDRRVLDSTMPGLDDKLVACDRGSLEPVDGQGISLFRAAGGAKLLAPTSCGGTGGSAVEAVAVQRAVGSSSGSLAVGTTMHHFSMASLVAIGRQSTRLEWILIERIARQGLLLASGFAEGTPGVGILSPAMRAVTGPAEWPENGICRTVAIVRDASGNQPSQADVRGPVNAYELTGECSRSAPRKCWTGRQSAPVPAARWTPSGSMSPKKVLAGLGLRRI